VVVDASVLKREVVAKTGLGDTYEMSDNLDAPPLMSRVVGVVGEREVYLKKIANSDLKELDMTDTKRDSPQVVLAVVVGFGGGSRGP